MAMTLVSTVTLTSSGTITFTNIPQNGKDLLLFISGRRTVANDAVEFSVNGVNTNLTWRNLRGDGAAAASSNNTNARFSATGNLSTATSSTFSNVQVYISNYSVSAAKTFSLDGVTENNATTAYQAIQAISWNNTDAITELAIVDTFTTDSSVSLYTIS